MITLIEFFAMLRATRHIGVSLDYSVGTLLNGMTVANLIRLRDAAQELSRLAQDKINDRAADAISIELSDRS